jgi:hypothetical protein
MAASLLQAVERRRPRYMVTMQLQGVVCLLPVAPGVATLVAMHCYQGRLELLPRMSGYLERTMLLPRLAALLLWSPNFATLGYRCC